MWSIVFGNSDFYEALSNKDTFSNYLILSWHKKIIIIDNEIEIGDDIRSISHFNELTLNYNYMIDNNESNAL